MNRGISYICLIAIACGSSVSAQSLKEIMTPPADSADRENLRIWVPVERSNRCRLTVDILNSESKVIRHLVDFLAGPGYYNFYWDKKGDSGQFVDAGDFTYVINDCGKKKTGQFSVSYKRWERLSRLIMNEDAHGFELELMADSALVTIEWYGLDDSLKATAVPDTLLMKGNHNFGWVAESNMETVRISSDLKRGKYIQKAFVGDFVYIDTIRYIK